MTMMSYEFKNDKMAKKVAEYLDSRDIRYKMKGKTISAQEKDLDKDAMKYIQKVKLMKESVSELVQNYLG